MRPSPELAAVATAAALLLSSHSLARADDSVTQLWPELEVYRELDSNTRLYFLLAPVREVQNDQRTDISDLQVGAHIEFGLFPIVRAHEEPARYDDHRLKYLRLRTGVRYLDAETGQSTSEWRVIVQLTPRARLPWRAVIALRNEVDFRWINDVYSWRYRPRLRLDREFKAGRAFALSPYLSAELYWDSRVDDWNRELYEAGTAFVLSKAFQPQIYLARQVDEKTLGETVTNAIGFTFAFYF